MSTQGFVIFIGVLWAIAMLRLLPRAWRLDHVRPHGEPRRAPRELPKLNLQVALQPLLSLLV
jgi:hypothetical protein